MTHDLSTQEGLAGFLAEYFENFHGAQAGTLNAMLGPQLISCSASEKRLTIRFEAQDWMVNPAGDIHGGILASMLDFVMGLCSRCFSGGMLTPTIDLHVNYLRALRPGSALIAEAVCVKAGRSFSFINARAWSEAAADKLCVTADGSYYTGGNNA